LSSTNLPSNVPAFIDQKTHRRVLKSLESPNAKVPVSSTKQVVTNFFTKSIGTSTKYSMEYNEERNRLPPPVAQLSLPSVKSKEVTKILRRKKSNKWLINTSDSQLNNKATLFFLKDNIPEYVFSRTVHLNIMKVKNISYVK